MWNEIEQIMYFGYGFDGNESNESSPHVRGVDSEQDTEEEIYTEFSPRAWG